MAMRIVDGKEMRVPGRAMPSARHCRNYFLGIADSMALSEYRKLLPVFRYALLSNAFFEKGKLGKAEHYKEKILPDAGANKSLGFGKDLPKYTRQSFYEEGRRANDE